MRPLAVLALGQHLLSVTDPTDTTDGGIMENNEGVARWKVNLELSDVEGHSHARATLDTGAATSLSAVGTARLSPHDSYDVPEVGYELAAGRALAALAAELMRTASDDIAGISELERG